MIPSMVLEISKDSYKNALLDVDGGAAAMECNDIPWCSTTSSADNGQSTVR